MAPESADAYLKRVKLPDTIQKLLEGCCRDKPDVLKPYLLEMLREQYPTAANAAAFDFAAEPEPLGKWVAHSREVHNKVRATACELSTALLRRATPRPAPNSPARPRSVPGRADDFPR